MQKQGSLYTQLRNYRLPAAKPKSTRLLKRRLAGGQEWIQNEVNEYPKSSLPVFVAAMLMYLQNNAPLVNLKIWHTDNYNVLIASQGLSQICLSIWDNNGTIFETLTPIASL